MKSEFKLALGDKAKDVISGFTGTITGRVEYFDGDKQYLIQPRCDGPEFHEAQWISEGRLERAA